MLQDFMFTVHLTASVDVFILDSFRDIYVLHGLSKIPCKLGTEVHERIECEGCAH